jgi:NitT/TauT family transport system permease protein
MARAGDAAPVPAAVRFYVAHERAILGALMVILFLVAWEGLERGWWARLLHPLLGASAERWQLISYAVEPLLAALNATPQVAFLPLLVIWVGTGVGTRVLIIFLLAVLPLAINAHAAVRTTDPRLIKVAASFSASDWRLFRTIILPSAIPFLLAGLRLAVGRGMIGVVVGEIYGSAAGIGAMISQAGSRFQTDKVFVGVLTIVAIGVTLVEVVRRIERSVDVWRPPS